MQTGSTFSSLAQGAIVLLAATAAWAGPQQGASGSATDPQQVIEDWPDESQKAARNMLEKYGRPDGVTDSRLVWLDNGPWLRTIVYEEPVQHNFPVPHKDVLEQFIAYEVPEEKFTELARYDGSVVAYRTSGELSARCDKEAANILALNLANDVIEGERTVEAAREFYAQTIQQMKQGEKPEYTQSLQFETRMASATADPDEQYELETTQVASASGSGSDPASREDRSERDELVQSASLEGMTVVTDDDETVGEITRVMDEAGQELVRIQLDEGFLGVGEQVLDVPVEDLALTLDGQVRTRLDRDQLRSMAEPENKVGGYEDVNEQ